MKKLILVFVLCILTGCSEQKNSEVYLKATLDERIEVRVPEIHETITSPLTVSGKARGYWFFEATAPLFVTDWDGRIIGEGYIQATEDWMTEDFVNFSGEIKFDLPKDTPYKRGLVIFKRHNASGLPKNDAAVEIPVMFK